MFGLEKKYINFILKTINQNITCDNASFYIFGSRAKGNYKEYSDIDIAIDLNGEKIPADVLGKILINFEDSTLPYEVDIIDLNSIDENFKNLIQNSMIQLHPSEYLS